MEMKPSKVNVRIDELVLDGFAPGERYRLGEAVEREVARLLAERGVPSSLAEAHAIDRLDAGAFDLAPGSRPERIGVQVSQLVYRALSR